MADNNNQGSGLGTLIRKFTVNALGALRNRGELFSVEWQEEKARLTELFVWSMWLVFFGMMAMVLLTATIILLFPEDLRWYVAAAFTFIYFAGALFAGLTLRSLLKREPFSESLEQARKDLVWFESSK